MTLLNINKLLQFAVELELRGVKFYEEWAEKSETDELKMLFLMLADEEKHHTEIFSKIAVAHKDPDKGFEITEEYSEYLYQFANDILFNEKDIDMIKTIKDAIEVAKKQELDAMLFYTDIKNHVSAEYTAAVEQIISEERKHFKKLGNLQLKLKL